MLSLGAGFQISGIDSAARGQSDKESASSQLVVVGEEPAALLTRGMLLGMPAGLCLINLRDGCASVPVIDRKLLFNPASFKLVA